MEAMLDSGTSVSLVQGGVLLQPQCIERVEGMKPLRLVTASGDSLPIMDRIRAPVRFGELEVMHEFVIVDSLVAPPILGIDFCTTMHCCWTSLRHQSESTIILYHSPRQVSL